MWVWVRTGANGVKGCGTADTSYFEVEADDDLVFRIS